MWSAGRRHDQRVRAHRGDGGRDDMRAVVVGVTAGPADRLSAGRSRTSGCYVLDGGWAGAAGGGRGAVRGRGRAWRAGTWAGRADGGAVRGVPVRAAGAADVPDRGPGAVALATGELEFLGRADDQVKIRGFRIELGEVEAVLAQAPGWARRRWWCARTGPGTGGWSGYVVPAPAGGSDAAALRAVGWRSGCRTTWCRRRSWCWTLPLTVNGKLDRAGAARARTTGRRRARAPRTPAGGDPGRLFAEVLGVEPGRRRRQLLRPGRPFAAGDPAGQPGPVGAGRGARRSGRCSRRRPWPGWRELAGPARRPGPAAAGGRGPA